jgi:hypothetical protein
MQMTPNQLRSALDRLGLNQVQAGRLFGTGDSGRTMRRWIAGEAVVPASVQILIKLLLKGKIKIEDIENSS